MKVFLMIFSLFFLISASSDCCLSELEEELVKIESSLHDDAHSDDDKECEDCNCSTFCSYNILLSDKCFNLKIPQIISHIKFLPPLESKVVSNPFDIFHPPIA